MTIGADIPAGQVYCLRCGQRCQSDEQFCARCGTPLPYTGGGEAQAGEVVDLTKPAASPGPAAARRRKFGRTGARFSRSPRHRRRRSWRAPA